MESGGTPSIDLVGDRLEFLEYLTESGPADNRTIVEVLSPSHSTIDRAMRWFVEADLVGCVSGGYRTTLAGRMAARDAHDTFGGDRSVTDCDRDLGAVLAECGAYCAAIDRYEAAFEGYLNVGLPVLGAERRPKITHGGRGGGVVAEWCDRALDRLTTTADSNTDDDNGTDTLDDRDVSAVIYHLRSRREALHNTDGTGASSDIER